MTDDAQDAPPVVHRIRWFTYLDGKRIPRTASMRGFWPGYDATCSCGWDSRTGGATQSYIKVEVWAHKFYSGVTS
jgi:hypothetical protein